MKSPPVPTPAIRLINVKNLHVYLKRQTMHAQMFLPDDNLQWKANLNHEVSIARARKKVPILKERTLDHYLPFYFGPRSVMLFQLKTNWVSGYTDGQEPIIHLVVHAQEVVAHGHDILFTDGHALTEITQFFDSLDNLNIINWADVDRRYWRDTEEDNDRKRRKQAEFLIYKECPWDLVKEIVVYNLVAKEQTERVLRDYPEAYQPIVRIDPSWYY